MPHRKGIGGPVEFGTLGGSRCAAHASSMGWWTVRSRLSPLADRAASHRARDSHAILLGNISTILSLQGDVAQRIDAARLSATPKRLRVANGRQKRVFWPSWLSH